MNRQDIIEMAKSCLPAFEDSIQQRITIRVQDGIKATYDSSGLFHANVPIFQEVQFERCYVDSKQIVRNDWSLMPGKFKLAWIPSEYFDNLIIGRVVNVQQALNEKLLSEYLVIDSSE